MLVNKEKVSDYIKSIPPLEATLKECLVALKQGDLPKAAKVAKEDPALMFYLKELTTKPIYGFEKEIKDPSQIFGILGLSSALAVVESFMFSKILPSTFSVFQLTKDEYIDFQGQMLSRWVFILETLETKNDKNYTPLASLLTATSIFCDKLFEEQKGVVDEIKEYSCVNYNSILSKLAGVNVFHIGMTIGKKWEMESESIEILDILANKKKTDNTEQEKLAKLLYLLFFYVVSRPELINAGLNGFIELDTEFVGDVIVEFNQYMEEYDSSNS
ncbi:MAG: HDOD domain-containing protein [Campylobacterales bacterium]|nr:HDOD domain-containing protein [Campylobacterales bacterium]